MARTLATVEAAFLFAAASAMSLLWGRTVALDSLEVAGILAAAAVLAACCIVAFYYNDLYDLRTTQSLAAFGPRLVQSIGVAFVLLAVFYTVVPDIRLAEGPFLSSLVMVVGLLLPVRATLYGVMRRRAFAERVIVLGAGCLAVKLVQEIESAPDCGLRVIGVAAEAVPDDSLLARYPVLGPLEHFAKIVEEARPDRIFVALRERRGCLPVRELLGAQMDGVLVEDGVDVYERLSGKVAIEALTPSHLIYSAAFRKSRRRLGARRALNLAIGVVALVTSLPLMALIALAIKLDSAGPILFVQRRCGFGGKTFDLLKFRTMHGQPEADAASVWDRDDCTRVTRVGKWLRILRFDELPQFWNIVKGDMGLVGPRPEMAANVAAMTEEIPYFDLRHSIPPGITGWAQIRQGYSVNLEEVTEKMRYDLYYIKHMSFWFDVRILVDTVKIVIFGRGAR
jgi:sugar transferase (PEP-CTERM system associated)